MPAASGKAATVKVVALTGATGFLGGHVVTALADAGLQVKALTRRPQPVVHNVKWIEGSLSDIQSLNALTEDADILIHLAGLTKAITRDEFFDVNVTGSKRLFEAAQAAGVPHVIHLSSLAAREPRLSHYGASKAGAELLLTARKWRFSWTIIRPPAIYGPGDKEMLKLFKASRFGFLPAPGSTKNRFSMIHAADLAAALVAACDKSSKQAIVEIDDTHAGGYSIFDVIKALSNQKKNKANQKNIKVRAIPVPFAVLGTLGGINDLLARAINKPFMLTLSTARYLTHPDWTVKEARRFKHALWSPQFDLEAGLEDTLDWYRKNDLL